VSQLRRFRPLWRRLKVPGGLHPFYEGQMAGFETGLADRSLEIHRK
jgi:hypothetical protein